MKKQKKKSVKKIHYGKLLAIAIKKKGLKKVVVAEEQFGFSRQWLNTVIASGKFSPEQLVIVKSIIK